MVSGQTKANREVVPSPTDSRHRTATLPEARGTGAGGLDLHMSVAPVEAEPAGWRA